MNDPCCWDQDDEDSAIWSSECGEYFCLSDEDPIAAGFKFCPFCGGPIAARRWVGDGGSKDDGPVLLPVSS
jgi:hypothetical protein